MFENWIEKHRRKPVKGLINALESPRYESFERRLIKEFHRLRIQMKRLRYACEFMAPAYDGALDPFIDHTVELQDCLGDIQDTVFTREFIDYLFEDWKDKLVEPIVVFILGEIYQLQGEIEKERQKGFNKMWARFASEETIMYLNETLSIQATEEK